MEIEKENDPKSGSTWGHTLTVSHTPTRGATELQHVSVLLIIGIVISNTIFPLLGAQ
jgi:hypothetical protein